MKARLLLEDGTLFTGLSFGAEGSSVGEIVFNTSMTGYQEILTDPSYCGQMITMTFPLIGNYGLARDDYESLRPYAHGLIVREYAEYASNWRNEKSISTYLKEFGILGISGIDTRMLTRKIRNQGTMKGIITTGDESLAELQERLRDPLPHDLVQRVSMKSIHISPNYGKRVVLMDFGAKHNIQRELFERNCEVISVPPNTSAEEILRFNPDGVILSNGPGNPKDLPEVITTIQKLLGKVPMFGISLGHQLFALACGANTEPMKFGHRGNHPVQELSTKKIVMTTQNHGYIVQRNSIPESLLTITHLAINDGSIEGLEHRKDPAFTVQFHPESAPGPLDSGYIFDRFIELMDSFNRKGVDIHA